MLYININDENIILKNFDKEIFFFKDKKRSKHPRGDTNLGTYLGTLFSLATRQYTGARTKGVAQTISHLHLLK